MNKENPKSALPTLDSFYQKIREQIQHEDNLVNHRLTWLLGIEAFLFGAFAVLITSQAPSELQRKLPICIALFGLAFSLISIFSVDAAFRSLKRLRNCWSEHPEHITVKDKEITVKDKEINDWLTKHEAKSGYPPITYVGGKIARAGSAAYGTPALIAFAWIVLCVLYLKMGVWKAPQSGTLPIPNATTTTEIHAPPTVRPTSVQP